MEILGYILGFGALLLGAFTMRAVLLLRSTIDRDWASILRALRTANRALERAELARVAPVVGDGEGRAAAIKAEQAEEGPISGTISPGPSPAAARHAVRQPVLDPHEPYLALDNIGALYAILQPEDVEAARKARRQIVSFTPLSEQETKFALNNLVSAALESMPAIEDDDEGPISGEIGPTSGGGGPAAS